MKYDSNALRRDNSEEGDSPGSPQDSSSTRPLASYQADFENTNSSKAGELLHSAALRFLNLNRDFSSKTREAAESTGGSRNPVRRVLSKLRAAIVKKCINVFLKDYFASEAEFQMSLVQFLNHASKYVDERDGALFWELIRKVDYDITSARSRIEVIADSQTAELRSTQREMTAQFNREIATLSQRIAQLESVMSQLRGQATTLDSVVRGMEGILAGGFITSTEASPGAEKSKSVSSDLSYVLLENRFRGSESEIRERLKIYPQIFSETQGTVLEIGAGRGELLQLFKEAGIKAYGVDTDAAMVQLATNKGLDSRGEDGISHLRGLADGSLGAVVAVQVVEHLKHETLMELVRLCAQKVHAGGKVVFETINPCSLTALSSNYFRDPSHVFPQHPDTLSFALTLAGLDVIEVRPLSPVPSEALLREIPIEEYMTPRWAELVSLMNSNVKRINDLLFGFQDYCVIAQVRQKS